MEVHILLLLVTLFLVVTRFILNHRVKKRQPPGPTGLPIIGNLHQLGPKPHCSLSLLAQTYGPIISLQKNDQAFAKRPIPESVAAQPNVSDTLTWVPADPRWRNRRRLCTTQIFTAQRLDLLQHHRQRKVQQLVEHLQKQAWNRKLVDIGELAFRTRELESAGELKELVWRIMEGAGKVNLSDYFPLLKRLDLQGVKRHVVVPYVRLHEIFDDMIRKRVAEREGRFLRYEQREGSDFTLESIKPLILDLFIAGSDTSGSTSEWAMAELLRNPEAMQKAREELIQVICTSNEVKESDIPRLPYIQAIVKETLRLHPPVPLLLPYVAAHDVKVCGYTIHKGNQGLINAWSIGRNPRFWDNPLLFQPERFLRSKIDFKGRDFMYLPFGAGRRICPGLSLANRMITLMLATFLHSFEWELPQGVTPQTLDMSEQYGITLKRLSPLCAIPISDASLNNVMTTVFGRRYNHDESNSSYEVEEVREMVMEGFEILGAFNWSDYVPWISFFYDPLRIRERCSVLAPRVKKFVKRVLEEHRIMPSFKELSDDSDFVDVLLSLEGDDKLQDDDIIAVLWKMIFRGTDTTALLTEWVMAELILNQQVQTRLREELDKVVGNKRVIANPDVIIMPYLEAIVMETLRSHPIGPLLSWARLSTSDVQLSNGMVVPANTTISSDFLNLDPNKKSHI
ncbi:Geraniol 8-hydroxylase [Glycine soja]